MTTDRRPMTRRYSDLRTLNTPPCPLLKQLPQGIGGQNPPNPYIQLFNISVGDALDHGLRRCAEFEADLCQ